MTPPSVTKCICHNRTFKEIKQYADEHGYTTVEELRRDRYCSCGCQMCGPYIELVLKTGETGFEPGAPYKRKRKGTDE